MLSAPPNRSMLSLNNQLLPAPAWATWFSDLFNAVRGKGGPFQLPVYVVTKLPAQATGSLIYVSNATGGAVVAYSDGTHWKRMDTNTVIS